MRITQGIEILRRLRSHSKPMRSLANGPQVAAEAMAHMLEAAVFTEKEVSALSICSVYCSASDLTYNPHSVLSVFAH
jgi:ribonucleotide monophosphatase NagD (HAD superfamily)